MKLKKLWYSKYNEINAVIDFSYSDILVSYILEDEEIYINHLDADYMEITAQEEDAAINFLIQCLTSVTVKKLLEKHYKYGEYWNT